MMRIFLISLAAAASALAVASPASAQWAPPVPYGAPAYGGPAYGAPAYGYQNHGQVRALQVRVDRLRERIHNLDRRNRLSRGEARRLDGHAIGLQRRIHTAAYRGLNGWERRDIEHRVEALGQAVRYAARENRRWGWNGQNAYDNSFGYYGARFRDDDRRSGRDDDRRYDRDDDDDDDHRGRGRGRGRDD